MVVVRAVAATAAVLLLVALRRSFVSTTGLGKATRLSVDNQKMKRRLRLVRLVPVEAPVAGPPVVVVVVVVVVVARTAVAKIGRGT